MFIGWPLNAPMVRFLVIIANGCLSIYGDTLKLISIFIKTRVYYALGGFKMK